MEILIHGLVLFLVIIPLCKGSALLRVDGSDHAQSEIKQLSSKMEQMMKRNDLEFDDLKKRVASVESCESKIKKRQKRISDESRQDTGTPIRAADRFTNIEEALKKLKINQTELKTQVNNEFKSVKNEFKSVNNEFKSVKNEFKSVNNEFKSVKNEFKSVNNEFKSVNKAFKSVNKALKELQSDPIECQFGLKYMADLTGRGKTSIKFPRAFTKIPTVMIAVDSVWSGVVGGTAPSFLTLVTWWSPTHFSINTQVNPDMEKGYGFLRVNYLACVNLF